MAAHTAALNDRAGEESGAVEALQAKHAQALAELKDKIDAENKAHLESVKDQIQNEATTAQQAHQARIAVLEAELKTLQEKYNSEVADLKQNSDAGTDSLKAVHATELESLKAAHADELVTVKNTIKVITRKMEAS